MEKFEKDAARPGGLGDMKMGESDPTVSPEQARLAAMPSHEAYHEYNKGHLDSLNTPGEDPEYARHVGQDTEFGYERRYPVRLASDQDEELLAHLHAMGHHLSRTHGDPDSSTPDDMARDERLATHHQQMAQRHHDEYARKFKLYSGQPIGGHGPGSWDMLEEGHEGVPGTAHPADDRLPRKFAKEEVTPEGHIEAAAHHLRHRDENVKHGTTWSEPAAKMHDVMYREHMEALGEDPDAPSALIQSKAAQVRYEGGPKYPGHTVFHRWDNLSNVRKFEPVLGGDQITRILNQAGGKVDAQGKSVPAPTPVPTQGPPPPPPAATAKHAIEDTNALLRKHQEEMFAPLEKVEELEKAEALEKKRHSFRNQAATPRPKGFHYIRQPVRMPVAVGGLVRRGKVVGKRETDPAAEAAGKRTTPTTPAERGEEAARLENRRRPATPQIPAVAGSTPLGFRAKKGETPAHPTLPGEAAEASRMEAKTAAKPAAPPKTPASALNMKWYRAEQAKLGKK